VRFTRARISASTAVSFLSSATVVSHDGGRTWRAAELPDQPPELVLMRSPYGLLADGDLMAVLGRDPTSASPDLPVAKSQFFVWTTIGEDR
jgi:hypothetical protein